MNNPRMEELSGKSDHDLLIITVVNQENQQKQVDEICRILRQHIEKYHPTLSKRVARLEGFRWWVVGAFAAASAAIMFALKVFG